MKIKFTILILLASLTTFAQKKDPSIKILSASDGVFHFKVTEKLQDAFVEVLDASNRVISKQPLDCKRMLIDFYDATPGTYHIHILAKNFERTYDYTLAEEKGYMKITTAIVQPENLSFEKYNSNKTK
ncbi:MAG: hypothetical protein HOP30_10415 [Cyclobacteriaceae bacterium]|nr:hypothetical protein [Cyclobacteriaceae bacterium]